MNVDDCINLDDLRVLAKKRVPKLIYDFIEGGSEDESGLVRNEDAFRNRALVPRYMVDITAINQDTELFGRTYSSAYGISPTGGISNYRHQGDLMLARAARDANIPFIMSGAATAKMEDMARECPNHGWYQLYTAKDRSISEDQIRRAQDLGIKTLVITVDVPASGNRERNKRNGFGRPLKLTWECKFNALKHPLWLKDYLTNGIAMLANWEQYAPEGSSAEEVGEFVSNQFPGALTWTDIEKFRQLWSGNLVLKGVMRVDDALRAAEVGVDGLMISNHGARQLDRAPAPLDVLPAIDAAVGDRMTLMLDGGVRRGADIMIALCLGAKFVFVGRPTLYGCIAGGQLGATKAVEIVRSEIETNMKQLGCPALDQLGPDFLHWDIDEARKNMRA